MSNYHERDLLRIAKRYNNPKRSYLLVNPLQAKHVPVSPKASLKMMYALGDEVKSKYPRARVVIGFAETATAIGVAVAQRVSKDCFYIHTTREKISGEEIINFSEEHSHASEQWLYLDRLKDFISESPQIIFVDDEISTGRTLLNAVSKLRERFPEIQHIPIVAASVLSRLSDQDEQLMLQNGIETLSLLKIDQKNYTELANKFFIEGAQDAPSEIGTWQELCISLADPRRGVNVGEYTNHCRKELEAALKNIDLFPSSQSILVLGTEECMYPALLLGELFEDKGFSVSCHATTRSPIGISAENDYPIRNGYRFHSFYSYERTTFLYNLHEYDVALIISDAKNGSKAAEELSALLRRYTSKQVYFLRG